MEVIKSGSDFFCITLGSTRKEIFVGEDIVSFKNYNEYILFINTEKALFLCYSDTVKKLAEDVTTFDISDRKLCYQQKNLIVWLEFQSDTKLIQKVPIFVPFDTPILCISAAFGYFCVRQDDKFLCFFGDFYKSIGADGEFQAYGFTESTFWAQRADLTHLTLSKY